MTKEHQGNSQKLEQLKGPKGLLARPLSEIYLRRENNSVRPPQGSVSHFQDLSYFELYQCKQRQKIM